MKIRLTLPVCMALFTCWSSMALADSTAANTPQAGGDLAFQTCASQPWQAKSLDDLNTGLTQCSTVLARKDASPEERAVAFTDRGWIEFELGHFSGKNPKALADLNAAITLSPDLATALAGRALLSLNSGADAQAVTDYTQLLAMAPPTEQLLVGRGDAYNNLQKYDKAIADFDQAIALNPKNAKALNDRAWALARKGEYAQAVTGYNAALATATNLRGIVLSNRCEAKAMLGKINDALADCNAAINLHQNGDNALVCRGFAHLKGRQFAAAIADYNAALAITPDDNDALFARGVARLQAGQAVKGHADIAAAKRNQPSVEGDMARMGLVLAG